MVYETRKKWFYYFKPFFLDCSFIPLIQPRNHSLELCECSHSNFADSSAIVIFKSFILGSLFENAISLLV